MVRGGEQVAVVIAAADLVVPLSLLEARRQHAHLLSLRLAARLRVSLHRFDLRPLLLVALREEAQIALEIILTTRQLRTQCTHAVLGCRQPLYQCKLLFAQLMIRRSYALELLCQTLWTERREGESVRRDGGGRT